MAIGYYATQVRSGPGNSIRVAYREVKPTQESKGIILLIHGFPETSYQFRHVMPLLAAAGYHVIAPDYRGAGRSSKPNDNAEFTKTAIASDIQALLVALDIKKQVHLVGHDIGGMIAYAFASRYPEHLASVTWGECPLPGTQSYRRIMTDPVRTKQYFHFIFHCAPDGLAERLVTGKERDYIEHFYTKLGHNVGAFSKEDIDEYEQAYAQPGAMRCAFATYRAFEQDAEENLEQMKKGGKCRVPMLCLNGSESPMGNDAREMALDFTDEDKVTVKRVPRAGHWIAEENPDGFTEILLDFITRMGTP